ncbi:Hypothetical predicted protein [Lecanosticta acicola]|uniref:Uncharacterized protein n=1 Tax=Lecanosticta acicola TaxID=111012 RepID=A0AAI9E9W8_9PEZI|nr:Hypothetical predicted protein [Lecanosticta acicola]
MANGKNSSKLMLGSALLANVYAWYIALKGRKKRRRVVSVHHGHDHHHRGRSRSYSTPDAFSDYGQYPPSSRPVSFDSTEWPREWADRRVERIPSTVRRTRTIDDGYLGSSRFRSPSPVLDHHRDAYSPTNSAISLEEHNGRRAARDQEQDRIRQMYNGERDRALDRAARGWQRDGRKERYSSGPAPSSDRRRHHDRRGSSSRHAFVEPSSDTRMMRYEEPPSYSDAWNEKYDERHLGDHGKRRS